VHTKSQEITLYQYTHICSVISNLLSILLLLCFIVSSGPLSPRTGKPVSKSNIASHNILSTTIPAVETAENVTFYLINIESRVQRPNTNIPIYDSRYYTIRKRYSQFSTLHSALVAKFCGDSNSTIKIPDLPPKSIKLFSKNSSAQFIEERRILLESWLTKILNIPEITGVKEFVEFLNQDVLTGNKEMKEDEAAAKLKQEVEEQQNDDLSLIINSNNVENSLSTNTNSNANSSNNSPILTHSGSGNNLGLDGEGELTGLTIPSFRIMTDHVLYQIDCINNKKRRTFSKWSLLKRFEQFYELDSQLRRYYSITPEILNSLPLVPSKKAKILHDHSDPQFIEQRRILLEAYLIKMLKHQQARKSKDLLQFLGVDTD
jgi:hypothetical protein